MNILLFCSPSLGYDIPLINLTDAEKLWASDMKLYRVNVGYGDVVTFDPVSHPTYFTNDSLL